MSGAVAPSFRHRIAVGFLALVGAALQPVDADTVRETVANTPPVIVAGATVFGYALPDVAAFVTIVYTLYLFVRAVMKDRKGKGPKR